MARNGNPYNYGNGGATTDAIKRVKLPDKIKCGRCNKQKGHHSYSKNRLGDLQAHIYNTPGFDATKNGHVSCQMCSGAGAQQLELECVGCDRVLPKARFTKVQCKNPDNARCAKCVQERLNYEPGADSSDDDSGHEGSNDGSNYGDDLSAAATTFSDMSISGSGSAGGGVSLNGSSAPKSSANATASNSRAPSASNRDTYASSTTTTGTARSNWTTTTASKSTSTFSVLPSGFNANAYGTPPHLRAQGAARNSSGGGKFAKVRASDAAKRPVKTKQQPAAAPGTHDDDDIGVAPESDSD